MIHRMREFNDLDSNLWEFYLLEHEGFKYRVVDVNLPLPGLESTTIGTGQKYWSDVTVPEEITVTLRETSDNHVFTLMWLWQNQIFDYKNKVFRTGNKGGKKDGRLVIQKSKFGGLLNFARIKFLQEINTDLGSAGAYQALGVGSQQAQVLDILGDGNISSTVENFLFENKVKFELKGLRPKKIEDLSMSYGNTEGTTRTITLLLDDVEVNTKELATEFAQFFGLGSSALRLGMALA